MLSFTCETQFTLINQLSMWRNIRTAVLTYGPNEMRSIQKVDVQILEVLIFENIFCHWVCFSFGSNSVSYVDGSFSAPIS